MGGDRVGDGGFAQRAPRGFCKLTRRKRQVHAAHGRATRPKTDRLLYLYKSFLDGLSMTVNGL